MEKNGGSERRFGFFGDGRGGVTWEWEMRGRRRSNLEERVRVRVGFGWE